MKTIDELRDYLLENFVDEFGDLDISGLDFNDFGGDVIIAEMIVEGNLYQDYQEVGGLLWQGHQKVQGNLHQRGHEVKGNLHQNYQEVQGSLYQDSQIVQGDLYNRFNKYGGNLYEDPSTKLLKEITTEELAKMGYKIKEG